MRGQRKIRGRSEEDQSAQSAECRVKREEQRVCTRPTSQCRHRHLRAATAAIAAIAAAIAAATAGCYGPPVSRAAALDQHKHRHLHALRAVSSAQKQLFGK